MTASKCHSCINYTFYLWNLKWGVMEVGSCLLYRQLHDENCKDYIEKEMGEK